MKYVKIVTSVPLFTVQCGQCIEISKIEFREIFGMKENEVPNSHDRYKWRDFLFVAANYNVNDTYRLLRIE